MLGADLRPDLGRITAPTLLIAGDHDAFVSADQSVLLAAIPSAQLDLYEAAGHGVHLAQPNRVVNNIVDFLAARTTGAQ